MFASSSDLEGNYLSLEETSLKDLKKQLNNIFRQIEDSKEQFDTTKDNLTKHRIVTQTEKMMN